MNKLFKTIIIFIVPSLILFLFLFSLKINFHDWKYGHFYFNTTPRSINWFLYKIEVEIKKLNNSYFTSKKKGLNQVKLIVPEKSSQNLLSEIPNSTKKWNQAYLSNGNKLQKIKIRYFGDNPYNFMFEQKSIRFKTRKSEMFGKRRYFEYKSSQHPVIYDYVARKLAKKLEIIVSEVKLVELFINNQSRGIYLEKERLDENFLRRNKIMPVNLYKGENYNIEKKLGLDADLYNNPGLWEKNATFNYIDKDEKKDLIYFFKELKKADNSYQVLNKILLNENIKVWSKISVFQILNQREISAHINNARLIIDPWSGKIHFVPHDVYYVPIISSEENVLDWSNNFLMRILNRSSKYLDHKYSLLYQVLTKKKILSKQANELEIIKDNFLVSEKRNIGLIQQKYYFKRKKFDFNDLLINLKEREKTLIKFLEQRPKASWDLNDNGFSIKINGRLPVSNLKVIFDKKQPKWIAIDTNNNSLLDDEDKIFYNEDNKEFILPITLFANRTNISEQNLKVYRNSKLKISHTYFNFIVENDIKPIKVYGSNKYTNKSNILIKNSIPAVSADIHNKVILNITPENDFKIFSGKVYISEDLIINKKTKILPGTSFYLKQGASIVFKNKVIALGSTEKPILFNKIYNKQKPWGTIAIHGKKTAGSILKNIVIDGGSGDIIDNIYYTSMLSLHDTQEVKLQNLKLKNNDLFDDMLHIVYSNNIELNNLLLESSKFDAIDIDISTQINISNSKINNSGNDGIDIMESEVSVNSTLINNSKDKGISTGENSKLKVHHSIIENNNIGIASKDRSIASITKSNLNFNISQLSAYQKNWRYGSGGKILADDLNFLGAENLISSENNSEILIKNSNFKGIIKKTGNVLIK